MAGDLRYIDFHFLRGLMDINDIINKQFSRVFKGYDIQEVDAFLDEIIHDYEVFEKNNKLMITRIHALLDEIERLENMTDHQNKHT